MLLCLPYNGGGGVAGADYLLLIIFGSMIDSTLELEELGTEEPIDWLLSLSEFLECNL